MIAEQRLLHVMRALRVEQLVMALSLGKRLGDVQDLVHDFVAICGRETCLVDMVRPSTVQMSGRPAGQTHTRQLAAG